MPEICRFYGIVIRMYFNDHLPAHFHAQYGDHEATINIRTLTIEAGHLPSRASSLVIEWGTLHQDELDQLWTNARNLEPLARIDPLP